MLHFATAACNPSNDNVTVPACVITPAIWFKYWRWKASTWRIIQGGRMVWTALGLFDDFF